MTLKELQEKLEFGLLYSEEYKANPLPHKVFTHAMVHIAKAAGRLFGLVDDLDHNPMSAPDAPRDYGRFLADIVIVACRAAQEFPGGPLDLEAAVLRRASEKKMLGKEPA